MKRIAIDDSLVTVIVSGDTGIACAAVEAGVHVDGPLGERAGMSAVFLGDELVTSRLLNFRLIAQARATNGSPAQGAEGLKALRYQPEHQ